jgi:hypothetical protein
MRISYGPLGHRGVSTLMAVGADEYPTPSDRARQVGVALGGAAFVLGLLSGSRTVRDMGAGAALALLVVGRRR